MVQSKIRLRNSILCQSSGLLRCNPGPYKPSARSDWSSRSPTRDDSNHHDIRNYNDMQTPTFSTGGTFPAWRTLTLKARRNLMAGAPIGTWVWHAGMFSCEDSSIENSSKYCNSAQHCSLDRIQHPCNLIQKLHRTHFTYLSHSSCPSILQDRRSYTRLARSLCRCLRSHRDGASHSSSDLYRGIKTCITLLDINQNCSHWNYSGSVSFTRKQKSWPFWHWLSIARTPFFLAKAAA